MQKYGFAEKQYVDSIIERIKTDKKMRACLSRADNPDTSIRSWEYLLRYNVDIENENELLRYGLVSAAIAREKPEQNGNIGIGRALACSYDYTSKPNDPAELNNPAVARLRRLLACDSLPEVCLILPPLIRLIQSKNEVKLDYAMLLTDLKNFGYKKNHWIKARWAKDFFHWAYKGEENDSPNA
jgi:CRISPR system Cascade subunit CasB